MYNYIGFTNENDSVYDCLCCTPENNFYIRIDTETIYQGSSKFKTKITDKTKLNLKFILNLETKKLNILNYDSNTSYGTINVTGKKFKFFVGKCCEGSIEYNILS